MRNYSNVVLINERLRRIKNSERDYKETTLHFAFAYGECMYMCCNLSVIYRKREKEKETRVLLNTEKTYDSDSRPRKVRNYRIT